MTRLIDADELKKALSWVEDCAYIEGVDKDIIEAIDNAPTVASKEITLEVTPEEKQKLLEILKTANFHLTTEGTSTVIETEDKQKENAVLNAYTDGYEKGKAETRPQGKWARHDEWVGGEYVGGFYHIDCPCIDLETAFYSKWRTNFCPNCGADMRGKEE